jgi:hypothetical protein
LGVGLFDARVGRGASFPPPFSRSNYVNRVEDFTKKQDIRWNRVIVAAANFDTSSYLVLILCTQTSGSIT